MTLFGREDAMIRLDMSEYMEKHSASKLIGSPPGYVGYDEGGQLTEKIRRKPYSVVLFDEIEKAHPDVFNLLLQVLEDGILTDSQGRRVDFKNTLLIMTSNLGASADAQPKALGFSEQSLSDSAQDAAAARMTAALKRAFRPEFLNRVDDIVQFRRLGTEEIRKIASLMLEEVCRRTADLGITLTVGEDVLDRVAAEGFDEAYGARPLRRAIVRMVEDTFSTALLEGKVKAGDTVRAELEDGQVVFRAAEPAAV
jgi:ATP-dependent Clp protease ATP-binding subunit ClpC